MTVAELLTFLIHQDQSKEVYASDGKRTYAVEDPMKDWSDNVVVFIGDVSTP